VQTFLSIAVLCRVVGAEHWAVKSEFIHGRSFLTYNSRWRGLEKSVAHVKAALNTLLETDQPTSETDHRERPFSGTDERTSPGCGSFELALRESGMLVNEPAGNVTQVTSGVRDL
jgi:hypothetical protein